MCHTFQRYAQLTRGLEDISVSFFPKSVHAIYAPNSPNLVYSFDRTQPLLHHAPNNCHSSHWKIKNDVQRKVCDKRGMKNLRGINVDI